MILYTLFFGVFVLTRLAVGHNALEWVDLEPSGTRLFARLCLLAAFIHAFGVWLNGQWRWSPAVRLVGLSIAATLFIKLGWEGAGISSTAGYTYLWITFGHLAALRTVLPDTVLSVRGEYGNICN